MRYTLTGLILLAPLTSLYAQGNTSAPSSTPAPEENSSCLPVLQEFIDSMNNIQRTVATTNNIVSNNITSLLPIYAEKIEKFTDQLRDTTNRVGAWLNPAAVIGTAVGTAICLVMVGMITHRGFLFGETKFQTWRLARQQQPPADQTHTPLRTVSATTGVASSQ